LKKELLRTVSRCVPVSAVIEPRNAGCHCRAVITHAMQAEQQRRARAGGDCSPAAAGALAAHCAIALSYCPTHRGLVTLYSCIQVRALAAENPTPQPELSPLINGRWALLYTTDAPGAAEAGAAAAGAVVVRDEMTAQLMQLLSPFQVGW
jgi:hypothetical protein